MKILLRLPNWLGDAVMATPVFYALQQAYPKATFTLVGSAASLELFKRENVQLCLDESKNASNRLLFLYQWGKSLGKHDLALTLQNNFFSAWLLWATRSTLRIGYRAELRSPLLTHPLKPQKHLHQVLQYTSLLSPLSLEPSEVSLHLKAIPQKRSKRIRIGVSAGAAYGSAKQWCKPYFIEVMTVLLQKGYEVFLYGGRAEEKYHKEMEQILSRLAPMQHFYNLTAQTTITQLIDHIASLDVFLSNDSGPMHIASALSIPLIALFGPTDANETAPFNTQSPRILLDHHLPCSPCKKRECPLKHHQCMKLITPDEVLNGIEELLKEPRECSI